MIELGLKDLFGFNPIKSSDNPTIGGFNLVKDCLQS